ncbi:hypothetical protein [Actinomadura craniellae]|uniref:hypothetical protein n=1 Tax=Actinomadura craniellae TaxID=2231787 RepID=UPI0013147C9A|nr:hypothetical protein [Actinomadura craniellae]
MRDTELLVGVGEVPRADLATRGRRVFGPAGDEGGIHHDEWLYAELGRLLGQDIPASL